MSVHLPDHVDEDFVIIQSSSNNQKRKKNTTHQQTSSIYVESNIIIVPDKEDDFLTTPTLCGRKKRKSVISHTKNVTDTDVEAIVTIPSDDKVETAKGSTAENPQNKNMKMQKSSSSQEKRKHIVYVYLLLQRADVRDLRDDQVWDMLRQEQEQGIVLFQNRRIYVGKYTTQTNGHLMGRRHRYTQNSSFDTTDSKDWVIYDWIVIQCSDEEQLEEMEGFLYHYALGLERNNVDEKKNVKVINRMPVMCKLDNIRLAFLLSKSGQTFKELAVYKSQPTPIILPAVGFYVRKSKFSKTILTLTKTSTEPSIYLGSQVEYHCNSTRFYFAYGLKWAFKRGNDDIEFVEETSPHIVREQYPLTSHMRKTTFRILNPDIKAIICFVPIAASPTEWRTVSLPIFIRDSVEVHHLDYVSNRVPFSSPSHLQPVVEPYSTSRPKLFLSQHHPQQSIEVDPTPTVDIEEIFSYARKPQENNEHIHNRASFHSSENYKVSSQIKFPTSYNNHEYKYSKTQPIIRQETDIITVDNFRQHHRQKLHNQHSDIQEANRRHREKLNKYPKSAASSSSQQVLTPIPTSQPESEYATTRRMYTKTPYYRDGYNFEERNREKEFPKFEGMEYKVSSKLNVGNHQHYKQGVVQDVESYQTTRHWSQPKSTTTIRPITIFNDRRYINEGESSQEIFSAPTPSKLTLNHRQPIIHFDSTQNQYSLRDPMISSTNPSKKYSTSGNDEKYYNSNIKPLSQNSWNHDHNNYYNRPSINSRRDYFPALSAEIPMALEDVGDHPYAFDDFYISSLTKGKTLKKKTPFKNYYSHGSQESLGNSKTSESHYQSIPLTPDYDKEKEQYYFQRYAGESKENSWTGIIRDN